MSEDPDLLPFKKGAFYLAVQCRYSAVIGISRSGSLRSVSADTTVIQLVSRLCLLCARITITYLTARHAFVEENCASKVSLSQDGKYAESQQPELRSPPANIDQRPYYCRCPSSSRENSERNAISARRLIFILSTNEPCNLSFVTHSSLRW